MRIARLWSPPAGVTTLEADSSAELHTSSIINWSMTLYHPPDTALLTHTAEGLPVAIGYPILYLDEDGDLDQRGEEEQEKEKWNHLLRCQLAKFSQEYTSW